MRWSGLGGPKTALELARRKATRRLARARRRASAKTSTVGTDANCRKGKVNMGKTQVVRCWRVEATRRSARGRVRPSAEAAPVGGD